MSEQAMRRAAKALIVCVFVSGWLLGRGILAMVACSPAPGRHFEPFPADERRDEMITRDHADRDPLEDGFEFDIAVPHLRFFPTTDNRKGLRDPLIRRDAFSGEPLSINSVHTGDSLHITYDVTENEGETSTGQIDPREREDLWEIQRRMIEALEATGNQECWKEAQRLRTCGSKGVGFVCEGDGCTRHDARLISCSSRFCVFCNRQRSAANQEKYADCVISMRNPMFATLTQRAIAGESLADCRDRAMDAFALLRRSKLWDNHVIGGVYSLEFTEFVDKSTGDHVHWHVHIHAIIDTDTGYIPLFRRLWRDSPAPGYRWSAKRKAYGETEELYQPRLEAALEESEEKLRRIKTFNATHSRLLRKLDRTHEYKTLWDTQRRIDELKAQYKQDTKWYKEKTTLTEVWLRCTRKAAEKAGIEGDCGNVSAYSVWLDPLRTIDQKENGIREVLKYACKPIAISGPGLAECVEWLREKKRVLISRFGALYGIEKEDSEPTSCPCCGQAGLLRCVGMVDTMCISITMSVRRQRHAEARETMEHLVAVLRHGGGEKRPPPDQHGWGRQVTYVERRANSSDWPDFLMESTGLSAYLWSEDDGTDCPEIGG